MFIIKFKKFKFIFKKFKYSLGILTFIIEQFYTKFYTKTNLLLYKEIIRRFQIIIINTNRLIEHESFFNYNQFFKSSADFKTYFDFDEYALNNLENTTFDYKTKSSCFKKPSQKQTKSKFVRTND